MAKTNKALKNNLIRIRSLLGYMSFYEMERETHVMDLECEIARYGDLEMLDAFYTYENLYRQYSALTCNDPYSNGDNIDMLDIYTKMGEQFLRCKEIFNAHAKMYGITPIPYYEVGGSLDGR